MVIKSRRLRWAGHVARMEEGRSNLKILTGKSIEKDLWGGLGVDGRTILDWILKQLVSIRGIYLIRLRLWNIGQPL